MVSFNEAMLSNDRTLAIRVGDFTSENIKSANFKYGYITGDDFTPGGTYAGTASILFTSVVESFKKLDVVYPEIGLLVGSKVEWVKMGKYYIDDIKIDRNANTTEIELMDEMFKLNESFKTDLKYPAQIRDVILEIATKTGVTLASDDFGITAIQQHVDEPTGDKLTYRDVLSQASQLLGFSCFFNRNGELEVRGLTESGITITADNYFLHGLEKSEVEYQIAGITCETKDDEVLTVGLQTGRSLEIENPLATQDTLNALYYVLKDITYYPYDLSYQGHLKLDVGQWVTIKTNKDEVFKVPVLYQSFSFSGGLTSTISADSVAGNDAQYTYGSFVTKKINQKSTRIQAEVQQQLKYADEEFKKVSNEMLQQSLEYQNSVRNELATSKAELETQIDTAKTQAESNAKAYADEINQVTAEVAEQASTAANSLKSDLAKVKTDLTTVTNTANSAKTSASEVKQQLTAVANNLNTAKQDLQNAVSAVDTKATNLKSDLTKAKQELAQATQNVKGLDTQIKSVSSQLGTQQTTLTQLVNDGNARGQKIANFETSLDGVTTKLQNLWNGSRNLLSDTERLTGYEGVLPYPKNHYLNKAVFRWTQLTTATTYQEGLVMQVNDMLVNPKEMILSFYANASTQTTVRCYMHNPNGRKDVETSSGYTATDSADGLAEVVIRPGWNRYWVRYTYKVGYVAKPYVIIGRSADTVTTTTTLSIVAPALYHGHYNRDWQPSDVDMSSAFAVYKQTVDQNYASLQSNLQTLDGTIKSNKATADQTAEGFKTRIESLETYKNGEATRANQYFESAKTETARQLTAERTAIAKDYVAKSTYTSDVTGIRNDLTATTVTADTTKTNLANYQASNDKAVANLQSNLQTANGNISSLQTKVEAVPGQITSAVSAVEGKIPTEIGGRNLWIQSKATGGFVEEILPDNHITGQKKCYRIPNNKELGFDIEPDFSNRLYRKVTFSAWVKYENVVQGTNDWNKFNCFKHVMVRKNSSTGATTGTDYITLEKFTGTSDWKYITYTYDYAANKSYDQLKTRIKFNLEGVESGNAWVTGVKIEVGSIPSDYSPAPEDTVSQISSLSSQIQQTADGMTLLATKTELNTAKSDLQSGITTATNKANTAQSTANSNAQTISIHTTQISALNTGLSAKVSQTDFNTLSGRVTTAENNITAKANELSSKITSVEGKIPKSASQRNLVQGTSVAWSSFVNITANNNWKYELATVKYGDKTGIYAGTTINIFVYLSADEIVLDSSINPNFFMQGPIIDKNGAETWTNWDKYHPFCKKWSTNLVSGNNYRIVKLSTKVTSESYLNINGFKIEVRIDGVKSGKFHHRALMVTTGDVFPDSWSPAPEDYDSKLASAQSEIKQTTDSIKASVSSLDKSTVKSASLTINTDGIVMKAGKSTTDVANAIGSYFSVNQNAINLFSDKINVKGSMIVDGAITSAKIASKSINTAHLNGKIITADVIATNAITADAIKAGAITTNKMTANSINGDRITAGTLDAAKIKAGSITASQIASGTITSSQIKAGGISTANIAAGAITTDKIISGAIDGDKIAANAITADKIATNALTAELIQGGILKSRTNSIKWDLDHSNLTFSEKGKIVFTNTDNTISYTKKQTTGLLKFNDADYNAPEVTLGVNRSGGLVTNDGTFTGVRVRGYKYSNGTFIDEIYNIGDKVILTGGYNENNGFLFQTAGDNLGFFPRANRQYALGSPNMRFTTLYLDDINIRISSTKTYSVREVINTLAAMAGVRL